MTCHHARESSFLIDNSSGESLQLLQGIGSLRGGMSGLGNSNRADGVIFRSQYLFCQRDGTVAKDECFISCPLIEKLVGLFQQASDQMQDKILPVRNRTSLGATLRWEDSFPCVQNSFDHVFSSPWNSGYPCPSFTIMYARQAKNLKARPSGPPGCRWYRPAR